MKIFIFTIIILMLCQFLCADPILFAFNEFKPNEYYYMLADGVRIRSQPNLNGEIIGRLPIHSRIKVISSEEYESYQEIDGVSAYWYLIEYENITGYIWGGYIAANTLIYDIDNNGIDDYFHYRVSSIAGPGFYQVDAWNDVVIYINNKRIPTQDIVSKYSNGHPYHVWGSASFNQTEKSTVLITMFTGADGIIYEDTFEIDKAGKIAFIGRIEEEVDY